MRFNGYANVEPTVAKAFSKQIEHKVYENEHLMYENVRKGELI